MWSVYTEMTVHNSASKCLAVGHRTDPLGEIIGNVPSVADALTPMEHDVNHIRFVCGRITELTNQCRYVA